jgi:hypothetical protein
MWDLYNVMMLISRGIFLVIQRTFFFYGLFAILLTENVTLASASLLDQIFGMGTDASAREPAPITTDTSH